MPVTYACLTEKVKLREESASMGAEDLPALLSDEVAILFVVEIGGDRLVFGVAGDLPVGVADRRRLRNTVDCE